MKLWGLNQISPSEKENILSLHKEIYDGYRTLQPKSSNEQPLYVQDFAKDKAGMVLNNKGVAKPYTNVGINEAKEEMMCSECGGMMQEDECSECGYKMEETQEGYETGKLSDIHNIEDLGDSDFDYVEGGGNKVNTFEKMHHMKGIKTEDVDDGIQYGVDDPDNEDDGFEDIQADESEMYEQGFTGGGNAPDMDISNIEPAYDFMSDGPGDVYPTESELYEDHMDAYEPMESAWLYNDEFKENDISGVQGIYGDMDPAYDFDSEGPGKAGPYQRSSYSEEYDEETDELDDLDNDIKESFIKQKNKIQEMFNRMKVVK